MIWVYGIHLQIQKLLTENTQKEITESQNIYVGMVINT